ncbi:hypothetical protein M409DRAFT_56889 [Zasmidium cellare ATCC 36951]|uniref:Uncharacterized protein n=1 Tax=Zasmidium cellare ATCC 36951 TaxID=1080233 RepID=A0A6A6CBM7_ZASCE|nr:uncharacterized protein M409DRAFT_56889 [Zasmidium cellare ATCC 36951]KAF2164193.1 hypothetical protein M409DRAFT_56889 [Zasmidium cellare ATCC 36951]
MNFVLPQGAVSIVALAGKRHITNASLQTGVTISGPQLALSQRSGRYEPTVSTNRVHHEGSTTTFRQTPSAFRSYTTFHPHSLHRYIPCSCCAISAIERHSFKIYMGTLTAPMQPPQERSPVTPPNAYEHASHAVTLLERLHPQQNIRYSCHRRSRELQRSSNSEPGSSYRALFFSRARTFVKSSISTKPSLRPPSSSGQRTAHRRLKLELLSKYGGPRECRIPTVSHDVSKRSAAIVAPLLAPSTGPHRKQQQRRCYGNFLDAMQNIYNTTTTASKVSLHDLPNNDVHTRAPHPFKTTCQGLRLAIAHQQAADWRTTCSSTPLPRRLCIDAFAVWSCSNITHLHHKHKPTLCKKRFCSIHTRHFIRANLNECSGYLKSVEHEEAKKMMEQCLLAIDHWRQCETPAQMKSVLDGLNQFMRKAV